VRHAAAVDNDRRRLSADDLPAVDEPAEDVTHEDQRTTVVEVSAECPFAIGVVVDA